jgi:hypothetical protein
MTFAETVVISVALVSCVAVCAGAYVLSHERAARIQQEGISARAALKHAADEDACKHQEWYVPVLVELAKNPKVIDFIVSNPQLLGVVQKFSGTPPGK